MAKTNVKVQLIGEDGNIFNLLGITSRALKRAGYRDEAEELSNRIFDSGSYDEAVNLISEYVEIS